MPLRIDEVGAGDLIRELSPDGLDYFARLELSDDWPPDENALRAKFVRLGRVILLGAVIDFGPPNSRGRRRQLLHRDIMYHMRHLDEDARQRIADSAPEDEACLKGRWPLVDAGWSRIQTGQAGQAAGLLLHGESYDFGRATPPVRQETADIARQLAGPAIRVVVSSD